MSSSQLIYLKGKQDFKRPTAIAIIAIGISRRNPPASKRQPISVGSARTKRITATILATHQAILKKNLIARKNSQQNRTTNSISSMIFHFLLLGAGLLYDSYVQPDALCISGILLLLFQKSYCENPFSNGHKNTPFRMQSSCCTHIVKTILRIINNCFGKIKRDILLNSER